MLKKLVKMLAKMVGLEVHEEVKKHGETKVTLTDGDTVTIKQKSSAPRTERSGLNRHSDEMREFMNIISARIIDEGYKNIPDILADYDMDIVENWVKMQEIALGQHDPEHSDIESLNYNELINKAVELNTIQFEHRMIAQGRAGITEGQKNLIERLAREAKVEVTIPTNKFDASRMIESLNKKLGRENRTGDSKPTEPQMRKLNWLAKQVKQEVPQVNTIKEASDAIQKMQDVYNLALAAGLVQEEVKLCTEPQMAYMQRLYKMAGKRWIKTSAAKYAKMSVQEMSNEIQKFKDEVAATNPEINNISQGQANYIISLCHQLNLPCDVNSVKSLSKEAATKKIDELRRKLIVVLSTIDTTKTLTKEDVSKMTNNQVTELLKQMQMERRTNHYTDSPEVVDNKFNTIF